MNQTHVTTNEWYTACSSGNVYLTRPCSRDSSSACLSDRPRGLTHLLLPDIVRAFQTCLYSTAKRQITDQAVIITWGTEALEDHRLDLFFCFVFSLSWLHFSCYLDKTKAVFSWSWLHFPVISTKALSQTNTSCALAVLRTYNGRRVCVKSTRPS